MKAKLEQDYNTKIYRWDFKEFGLFEATFVDFNLTDLRFCKSGSNLETSLNTKDVRYLRAIYTALGELLEIFDKLNE